MKYESLPISALWHPPFETGCVLETKPMHKDWLISTPLTDRTSFVQSLTHILHVYREMASPSRELIGTMCLECANGGLWAPNGLFGTHKLGLVYDALRTLGEATVVIPLTGLQLRLARFNDEVAFSCNEENGKRFAGAHVHMSLARDCMPGILLPFMRSIRVYTHLTHATDLHAALLRIHLAMPSLEWYATRDSLAVALTERFRREYDTWVPLAHYYGSTLEGSILLLDGWGHEDPSLETRVKVSEWWSPGASIISIPKLPNGYTMALAYRVCTLTSDSEHVVPGVCHLREQYVMMGGMRAVASVLSIHATDALLGHDSGIPALKK